MPGDPFKILTEQEPLESGVGPFNVTWHNFVTRATRLSESDSNSSMSQRSASVAGGQRILVANMSGINLAKNGIVGLGNVYVVNDDEILVLTTAPAAGSPFGVLAEAIPVGSYYESLEDTNIGNPPPSAEWEFIEVPVDLTGIGAFDNSATYDTGDIVCVPNIGVGLLGGARRCSISITNAAHPYAVAIDDDYAKLASSDTPGVRIKSRETGTGVKKSVIDDIPNRPISPTNTISITYPLPGVTAIDTNAGGGGVSAPSFVMWANVGMSGETPTLRYGQYIIGVAPYAADPEDGRIEVVFSVSIPDPVKMSITVTGQSDGTTSDTWDEIQSLRTSTSCVVQNASHTWPSVGFNIHIDAKLEPPDDSDSGSDSGSGSGSGSDDGCPGPSLLCIDALNVVGLMGAFNSGLNPPLLDGRFVEVTQLTTGAYCRWVNGQWPSEFGASFVLTYHGTYWELITAWGGGLYSAWQFWGVWDEVSPMVMTLAWSSGATPSGTITVYPDPCSVGSDSGADSDVQNPSWYCMSGRFVTITGCATCDFTDTPLTYLDIANGDYRPTTIVGGSGWFSDYIFCDGVRYVLSVLDLGGGTWILQVFHEMAPDNWWADFAVGTPASTSPFEWTGTITGSLFAVCDGATFTVEDKSACLYLSDAALAAMVAGGATNESGPHDTQVACLAVCDAGSDSGSGSGRVITVTGCNCTLIDVPLTYRVDGYSALMTAAGWYNDPVECGGKWMLFQMLEGSEGMWNVNAHCADNAAQYEIGGGGFIFEWQVSGTPFSTTPFFWNESGITPTGGAGCCPVEGLVEFTVQDL